MACRLGLPSSLPGESSGAILEVTGLRGTDVNRYEDQRLLSVCSAIAKVWVDADADKLIKLPAPEGARHSIA
jgi:hypothetical protein